jgi:hypothetical protein
MMGQFAMDGSANTPESHQSYKSIDPRLLQLDLNPQEGPKFLPFYVPTHTLDLNTSPQHFSSDKICVEIPPDEESPFDNFLHPRVTAEATQRTEWRLEDQSTEADEWDAFLFINMNPETTEDCSANA